MKIYSGIDAVIVGSKLKKIKVKVVDGWIILIKINYWTKIPGFWGFGGQ